MSFVVFFRRLFGLYIFFWAGTVSFCSLPPICEPAVFIWTFDVLPNKMSFPTDAKNNGHHFTLPVGNLIYQLLTGLNSNGYRDATILCHPCSNVYFNMYDSHFKLHSVASEETKTHQKPRCIFENGTSWLLFHFLKDNSCLISKIVCNLILMMCLK